eukprot:TRINITY_DN7532_c0_g1_i1.p2 TRINITY_DN7532_c0_g1~~TRINITY_DN7532_c0_g1_i1.p2  ORF type:complete len:105 (-),score=7.27 TRINITY_DN7532_c0_g1_i1:44-358(-)
MRQQLSFKQKKINMRSVNLSQSVFKIQVFKRKRPVLSSHEKRKFLNSSAIWKFYFEVRFHKWAFAAKQLKFKHALNEILGKLKKQEFIVWVFSFRNGKSKMTRK